MAEEAKPDSLRAKRGREMSPVERLMSHATSLAEQCSNIVATHLVVADAPAVERSDPRWKAAIRQNLSYYGHAYVLRTPLKLAVERSKQAPIKTLSELRPHVSRANLELVKQWDGWCESASELLVYVASDLLEYVEAHERNVGIEDCWGRWVHDGSVYREIKERWRYRDIPIERLTCSMYTELAEWTKSQTPSATHNWPSGFGWEFRPNEGAFMGQPFDITGKPREALKKLAEKPGEPVLKETLLNLLDPNHDAPNCVSDAIKVARKILKDKFGLESDPIPVTKAPSSWKLVESIFPKVTESKMVPR